MTLLYANGFDHGLDEAASGTFNILDYEFGAHGRNGTRGLRLWDETIHEIVITPNPSATKASKVTVGFAILCNEADPVAGPRDLFSMDATGTFTGYLINYDEVARTLFISSNDVDTPSEVPLPTGWNYIEVTRNQTEVVLDGYMEVRLNGQVVYLNDGQIATADHSNRAGVVTTVRFRGGFDNLSINGGRNFDDIYILDEFGAVNNAPLGDVLIKTLAPTSDGASTGFTRSTGTAGWALLDEIPPSDTDFVSSDVVGTRDLYGLGAAPTGTLHGVVLRTFAKKSDDGARLLSHVVSSGAATEVSDGVQLGTASEVQTTIYETNPDDDAAWTAADVDAAEFGFEVAP